MRRYDLVCLWILGLLRDGSILQGCLQRARSQGFRGESGQGIVRAGCGAMSKKCLRSPRWLLLCVRMETPNDCQQIDLTPSQCVSPTPFAHKNGRMKEEKKWTYALGYNSSKNPPPFALSNTPVKPHGCS